MSGRRPIDNLWFAIPLSWMMGLAVTLAVAFLILAIRTTSIDGFLAELGQMLLMILSGPLAPFVQDKPAGPFQRGICCIFLPLLPIPLMFGGNEEYSAFKRWLPVATMFCCSIFWHAQGLIAWWLIQQ